MELLRYLIAASLATAQGPGRGESRDRQNPGDADDLVTRMMAFDKNKDGKLTMAEVTDERLHRLVERADADKDGFVTKEELTALGRERANQQPWWRTGRIWPAWRRRPRWASNDGGHASPGRDLAGHVAAATQPDRRSGEAGRGAPEGGRREAREDPDG